MKIYEQCKGDDFFAARMIMGALTQKEMASKTGLSIKTIQEAEQGNFSKKTWAAYNNLLNANVNYKEKYEHLHKENYELKRLLDKALDIIHNDLRSR